MGRASRPRVFQTFKRGYYQVDFIKISGSRPRRNALLDHFLQRRDGRRDDPVGNFLFRWSSVRCRGDFVVSGRGIRRFHLSSNNFISRSVDRDGISEKGLTRRCSQPLAAPCPALLHDPPPADHNPQFARPFRVAELDVRLHDAASGGSGNSVFCS